MPGRAEELRRANMLATFSRSKICSRASTRRCAAPGGADLAKSIREKYHAALVDEFQDTDPVQYSIF